MSLTNQQYDEIMRIYERRRDQSRRALEERQKKAYEAVPALLGLDARRADTALAAVRSRLNAADDSQEDAGAPLRLQMADLSRQAERLLTEAGFPADYLQPVYECSDCRDTGYIGSEKCHCFESLAMRYYFEQPGLEAVLAEETFDAFRLDYYPQEAEVEKGGRLQTVAVRSLMEKNLQTCRRFVADFDKADTSLLFSGGVGLGKTFLSHCIAGELIAQHHTVVYASAAELFRRIGELYFSQESTLSELTERLAGCDLLILDDLGTEVPSVVTHSVLFQLLNRRIDERRSTIISTNLDVSALSETYSERSVSRIISCFTLLPFYGEDIRLQKKLRDLHTAPRSAT